MEGYLEKKTGRKWHSHYFELGGHYLKYFEDKHKEDETNLLGAIDLAALRFCTVDDCNIFLELPDDEELKLKARSAQNAQIWCDEINKISGSQAGGKSSIAAITKKPKPTKENFRRRISARVSTATTKMFGGGSSSSKAGTNQSELDEVR